MNKNMKRYSNELPNAQSWLGVGQNVVVPKRIYAPHTYDLQGKVIEHRDGVIAEHLKNGGMAVRFHNYPNTVDYTNREANFFIVTH